MSVSLSMPFCRAGEGKLSEEQARELRTQEEEGHTSTEETVQIQHSTAQHSSRGRRGRSVRAIIRRTDELLPTPRWKKKAVFPAWSEQTGQERPRGCRDLPTGAQPDRKN